MAPRGAIFLGSERQSPLLLPSPLVVEGGANERSEFEPGEGSPRNEMPRPLTRFRPSAETTLSHEGRGAESLNPRPAQSRDLLSAGLSAAPRSPSGPHR